MEKEELKYLTASLADEEINNPDERKKAIELLEKNYNFKNEYEIQIQIKSLIKQKIWLETISAKEKNKIIKKIKNSL